MELHWYDAIYTTTQGSIFGWQGTTQEKEIKKFLNV
jgi:hypothetical protein